MFASEVNRSTQPYAQNNNNNDVMTLTPPIGRYQQANIQPIFFQYQQENFQGPYQEPNIQPNIQNQANIQPNINQYLQQINKI